MPEPHRQLLHHVEHREQQQQQRQQPIAPLGAGLRAGHDIAGVGVGQHHQQAGAPDRRRADEGCGAGAGRPRFAAHP